MKDTALDELTVLCDKRMYVFTANAQNDECEIQICINFSDNTFVMITHRTNGFVHDYDYYYSVKHIDCRNCEENGKNKVIASFKYANKEQLAKGLGFILYKIFEKGIDIIEF